MLNLLTGKDKKCIVQTENFKITNKDRLIMIKTLCNNEVIGDGLIVGV